MNLSRGGGGINKFLIIEDAQPRSKYKDSLGEKCLGYRVPDKKVPLNAGKCKLPQAESCALR